MPSRSTRGAPATSPPDTPADYCCSVCDRLLFVKSDDPPSPVTSWRCLACDQFFTVKSSVKRHVAKAHVSAGLPLVCQDCAISSAANLEFAELSSETADAVAEMEEEQGGVVRTSEEPAIEGPYAETHQVNLDVDEEATPLEQNEQKNSGFTGHGEGNIDGDLALFSLMLQHNLNLDVMESVISILRSGFDFSTLRNSKHWLQRLGKGASFNVKTCCQRCSHLDVQMVFGNGQSATISTQVNQNETSASTGASHEPSSGTGVPGLEFQQPVKPSTSSLSKASKNPKTSKQCLQMVMPPTTWKTVALQALRDNYSKEEIRNLYVSLGKGKRDASLEFVQTLSEEKRFFISDAVEKFSTSIGNHPPTETALNHYLSQTLSDFRRTEGTVASGNPRKRTRTDSVNKDPPMDAADVEAEQT